jgi:hypothetical protein
VRRGRGIRHSPANTAVPGGWILLGSSLNLNFKEEREEVLNSKHSSHWHIHCLAQLLHQLCPQQVWCKPSNPKPQTLQGQQSVMWKVRTQNLGTHRQTQL